MKKLNLFSAILILLMSGCLSMLVSAQEGFTNETRALYILDISKYVEFDESFDKLTEFSIAILDRDDQFYWDLNAMARTRKFVQGKPIQNRWKHLSDLPAKTQESETMSEDLKKKGFTFVGPTICYAFMQAIGMVNDHSIDCFRFKELGGQVHGS